MNQSQVLELLKEIEDSIFNGVRFFANAHWLSHGRVLESVTALWTETYNFHITELLFKYSIIKGKNGNMN